MSILNGTGMHLVNRAGLSPTEMHDDHTIVHQLATQLPHVEPTEDPSPLQEYPHTRALPGIKE